MKVTAIIPDDIVDNVKRLTKGETTTSAIIIALSEWVKSKEIEKLNDQLERNPLEFSTGFSAAKARKQNRR